MLVNQNMVARSFFFSTTEEKQETPIQNQLTIEDLLREQTTRQPSTIDSRAAAIPSPRPQLSQKQTQTLETIPANKAPILPAVPQLKPSPLKDNKPTVILAKEKAQIMRVQEALRGFGNPNLTVNGNSDGNTKKAILAFQKMFALKETGMINRELLNKMREIGLLENDTNGLY